MKIAIIGAGWYGCHLAKKIIDDGHDVTIFEKSGYIFNGASSKNQNRLHLGFHYPRSFITRKQSKDGFEKFKLEYGFCTKKIKNNIYAIDNKKSILDFETYIHIMKQMGLDFEIVDKPFSRFTNLNGLIKVNEEQILHEKASEYFTDILSENLVTNYEVTSDMIAHYRDYIKLDGVKYDFIINCSWGWLKSFQELNFYYEPALVLLYKSMNKDFALTIMDGQFVSLYPYNIDYYTLTSVKNTPIGQFNDIKKAISALSDFNEHDLIKKKNIFEEEIEYYYPAFKKDFSYKNYYISMKTKLYDNTDTRECIVISKKREIFIFSGKIDTIFHAEDQVKNIIY